MPWRPISGAQREIDAFTNEFEEEAIFYLDEPLGPNVAEMLKAMGYKVRMAADCGMTGRDDADHAALCWRDGMILVTQDHDFLNTQVVPEHRNPGVVVLDGDARDAHRAAFFVGRIVGPFGRHWRGTKFVFTPNGEMTVWVRNADRGAVEKTRYRWLRNRDIEEWVKEG
jgi:hypothetical protein